MTADNDDPTEDDDVDSIRELPDKPLAPYEKEPPDVVRSGDGFVEAAEVLVTARPRPGLLPPGIA